MPPPTDQYHPEQQAVKRGIKRGHQELQASEENEKEIETIYEDAVCMLCSDELSTFKHTHTSSEGVRLFAMELGNVRRFCLLCKASENTVDTGATRRIIATDETIYNIWSYIGLDIQDCHIEIEAIVRGRFRDMARAIIQMFLNGTERIELIVIAGINNIEEDQTIEDIKEEMLNLQELVAAHSELCGHSPPSIVSFSTVRMAPKLCSLDVHPNQKSWIPEAGFINKRKDIEELNGLIKSLNTKNKVNYLKVHMEGIRIDRKKNRTWHKTQSQSPIWRESKVFEKFNFVPEVKLKIANNAVKLFQGGLDNLGDWGEA